MPTLEDYLTVKQPARFLGVAANTIRNWDAAGKIPSYRHPINNYRLVRKEDLQRVLDRIDRSGKLPTGWSRQTRTKRKPR